MKWVEVGWDNNKVSFCCLVELFSDLSLKLTIPIWTKNNNYSDIDFFSLLFVKWNFAQISWMEWRLIQVEIPLNNPSVRWSGLISDLDFVILPDGHGSDSVLGSQLLREGSGHQASSDMRRGWEVTLPGLGTVRGHVFVQLHLLKSKTRGLTRVPVASRNFIFSV